VRAVAISHPSSPVRELSVLSVAADRSVRISAATALKLAFVAWHPFAGFLGTSLVYRLRFGAFPHVAWWRRARSRHRTIQLWMGLVSLAWIATVLGFLLSPRFRELAVGQPLARFPDAVGWWIAGLASVGVVGCQLAMGRALRVGLEEAGPMAPLALTTSGPFAWSRHPVYLFSMLFLVGEWTWNPCLACALCVVALMLGFHGLAVEEDLSLGARFGGAHAEYAKRVRRYL
jgi:protein-S-isoprenylcysteine O-methyltransferase Ste14